MYTCTGESIRCQLFELPSWKKLKYTYRHTAKYLTMCQACENLIYDILINPLPLDHELRDHINFTSLKRCAVEVAHCFYRVVKDFPIWPEFFLKEIRKTPVPHLRIRIPDEILSKYEYEELLWDRFHEECPLWAYELEHAQETCMDFSIGRNTADKKQLIKQFLMDRLHVILKNVPSIHLEHTEKINKEVQPSPGPVDIWKIIRIRHNVGLPIYKYLSIIETASALC